MSYYNRRHHSYRKKRRIKRRLKPNPKRRRVDHKYNHFTPDKLKEKLHTVASHVMHKAKSIKDLFKRFR